MSKEAIELLRILREETQSRDVLARCDAEIERLSKPKAIIGLDLARPGSDRSVFYVWPSYNKQIFEMTVVEIE